MSEQFLQHTIVVLSILLFISIAFLLYAKEEYRNLYIKNAQLTNKTNKLEKDKNTRDLQRQFTPCKDIEYVLHILDRRIGDIKDICFKLPETYTTHMMYLAVMELIKAERLYHLCPWVDKMISPKGLRGRTYKIWIEGINT